MSKTPHINQRADRIKKRREILADEIEAVMEKHFSIDDLAAYTLQKESDAYYSGYRQCYAEVLRVMDNGLDKDYTISPSEKVRIERVNAVQGGRT